MVSMRMCELTGVVKTPVGNRPREPTCPGNTGAGSYMNCGDIYSSLHPQSSHSTLTCCTSLQRPAETHTCHTLTHTHTLTSTSYTLHTVTHIVNVLCPCFFLFVESANLIMRGSLLPANITPFNVSITLSHASLLSILCESV